MYAPAEGGLVAGRFRLDRCLGRGGMGEVWAATHEVTAKRFALKFLTPALAVDDRRLQRLSLEAQAATAIDHPGVVAVHDVFALEDGTPVMVMELLEGETLAERIRRRAPMAVDEAATLLIQIAAVLGAAHAKGVVHRDIKPSNVFIVGGESGSEIKLLDFGIAKLASTASGSVEPLTTTGRTLGTPAYMAPEQSRGERDIDHRADIWALGVLMYEMLAGRRPIQGDTIGEIVERLLTEGVPPLRALAPNVPFDLAVTARSMLERERSLRPPDLRGVIAVLQKYTSREVVAFGPAQATDTVAEPDARADADAKLVFAPVTDPSLEHAPPPVRRRWSLLGLLAAALAVAFYAGLSLRQPSTDPSATERAPSGRVEGSMPPPAAPTASERAEPEPPRRAAVASAAPSASITPPSPRSPAAPRRNRPSSPAPSAPTASTSALPPATAKPATPLPTIIDDAP